MAKGIARATVDYSSTHSKSDTHSAPGVTKYISSQNFVLIDGKAIVLIGDKTLCGNKATEGSAVVLINGKGVHRLKDKCDSHNGTYSPSFCASASDFVLAE